MCYLVSKPGGGTPGIERRSCHASCRQRHHHLDVWTSGPHSLTHRFSVLARIQRQSASERTTTV